MVDPKPHTSRYRQAHCSLWWIPNGTKVGTDKPIVLFIVVNPRLHKGRDREPIMFTVVDPEWHKGRD